MEEFVFDRISCLQKGDKTTIPTIFLHGWMDNSLSFLPLSDYLESLNGYYIDLPGHGKSAHLNTSYTLETYCYWVLKLISHIKSQPFRGEVPNK